MRKVVAGSLFAMMLTVPGATSPADNTNARAQLGTQSEQVAVPDCEDVASEGPGVTFVPQRVVPANDFAVLTVDPLAGRLRLTQVGGPPTRFGGRSVQMTRRAGGALSQQR